MSDAALDSISWAGEPVLFITWQVSDVCNHRCSYCNEGNWAGNQPNTDIGAYLHTLEGILDRMSAQGYSRIKLFLSGGEPTHWQGLLPLMRWINHRKGWAVTTAVNTNLSRPTVWWERYHGHFDDVVASYHPEWVKHDSFVNTAQLLSTRVNYLAVRMLMTEQHWDDQLKRADEILDALPNVYLEYVPILESMSPSTAPYSYKDRSKVAWLQRQSLRIKETASKPRNRVGDTHTMETWSDGTVRPVNSNRITAMGANFFSGWQCDIGCSINIAINGDITLATCGQSGVIGNIATGITDDGLPASIICAKDHCHCGTDICIPKRRGHV